MTSPPDPAPQAGSDSNDEAAEVVKPGADPAEGAVAAGSTVDAGEVTQQTLARHPGRVRRIIDALRRPHRWRRTRDALRSDALMREVIVGLMVGVMLLGVAVWFDKQNAKRAETIATSQFNEANRIASEQNDHAEVLENTRFVRQAAMTETQVLPFQGLKLHGANLSGLPLGCDIVADPTQASCVRFDQADLTDADLSYADLSYAVLTDAVLKRAVLLDAKLNGAHLIGADLTGAQLLVADLSGAQLLVADLSGANLFRANLSGADLGNANLTGADLRNANLTGADLRNANLTGANLAASFALRMSYSDTNLTGANLTDICFDDSTWWPRGFKPPPAQCP